ncbi:AbrB/MazE/SpoVT family DNA-binding domain-containing protein [Syntrophomonas wolfei]|jgi:antitoxin component of MazEF toxin-antitoxin module|uniref:AbrB/MazE/SpoVT family DNA-binding domain-containing protein n=1 Tax=Syntrophomonas wolfei TaxID=863 RepID=UPI000774A64A|nr:AbrB/MazE/SpoVT family DNA-binding domain-containing protein [Syntrophomonas wolfei]
MIKTLTAHGNSSALIIDKAILELLNINNTTPLKLVTDGKSLIISPVREPLREERFQAALQKVNINHGDTLRKLGE